MEPRKVRLSIACTMMVIAEVFGPYGNAFCSGDAASAVSIASVRSEHPRLMLLEADVPRLREAVKTDPLLGDWYRQIRERAAGLLGAALIEYKCEERGNMLGACRQAVERIYALGLAYRIDGDAAFARRGIEELLHASALENWDPQHFLDTAELTHAVAIGYDWFQREFTPAQRATVRDAICRKGLEEGLFFYRTGLPLTFRHWDFNWAVTNHNWNQVCNGGMTIGALAVADEAPQLAQEIVDAAMRSIRLAMARFGPDGGWVEGPGYWEYATEYNVCFLAALETAIGPETIEPFLRIPGFEKTGYFRIHSIGPTNRSFNFADSRDRPGRSAQMFWLARRFGNPLYAWHARQFAAPAPLDLLWYDANQKSPKEAGLPLDAHFRGVEAVFFRSAWEDPNAVYVAFKGGDNSVNHGHLDLGTFVLDADGCRWALDLGRDNYALPGYFIFGKGTYYRLKTEGHNTLVFGGHNQRADAKAPVIAFQSQPDRAFAVADLSQGYDMPPGHVRRGITLLERRHVLVQDEFQLDQPAQVVWQMHTEAEVTLSGQEATLRQNDKTLTARILEPPDAVFEVRPAKSPPPETQQPDVRKLVIPLTIPPGTARLVVLLSPGTETVRPELKPLAAWVQQAPTGN